MKKNIILSLKLITLIILTVSCVSYANNNKKSQKSIITQAKNYKKPENISLANNHKISQKRLFEVGGVSIYIPAPDVAFVSIGDYYNDFRIRLKSFVGNGLDLLCAFALKNELPYFFTIGNGEITKYALVEVPRQTKNININPIDFYELKIDIKKRFGVDSTLSEKNKKDFYTWAKSLDLSNLKTKSGQPFKLGIFFSKKDVMGAGTIVKYDAFGVNMEMAGLIIYIHVKKRLIALYLYAKYKDENTILWLREVGENWSDRILQANK